MPVETAVIDLLSMYPTICILQNLWKFVIASRADVTDDTDRLKTFLQEIELERLFDPAIWRHLNVFCLLSPEDDILPVRARYGNKVTYDMGFNNVTS